MSNHTYALRDFLPLIVLAVLIVGITVASQLIWGGDLFFAMRIFMASFFIIFSLFKVVNLAHFAEAYATYDIIAKQIKAYAFIYPFIELFLGLAYLFAWYLWYVHAATCLIMVISALGVFNELRKKKTITCACLGMVFKIPMTYVTLVEDLLMAGMALYMLVHL